MNTKYQRQKLINYIDDYDIIKYIQENDGIWIAGGAVLSVMTNQDINDIDCYFKSVEVAYDFYEFLRECNYQVVCETKKSILMVKGHSKDEFYDVTIKFNLVLFDWFVSPEDVIDNFDFTVCKAAFDGKDFIFHEDFLLDVASRTLKYSPSFRYPLSTALRIKKYEDKGYKIHRNEYIKILLQITQRDINSFDDLEEELCGIYGVELSEHFDTSKPFDINKVIEKLGTIRRDVTTAKKVMDTITDLPQIFMEMHDVIEFDDQKYSVVDYSEYEGDKEPLTYPLTAYKWVHKKSDGTFCSHFRKVFEYKMGEIVKEETGRRGLNVLMGPNVDHHPMSKYDNSVKIEVKIFNPDHLSLPDNRKSEMVTKELLFVGVAGESPSLIPLSQEPKPAKPVKTIKKMEKRTQAKYNDNDIDWFNDNMDDDN